MVIRGVDDVPKIEIAEVTVAEIGSSCTAVLVGIIIVLVPDRSGARRGECK
jgi:hypothetical protein